MWIVPSRSRPENIARLTLGLTETPALLRLDKDDPELSRYLRIPYPTNWQITVGERRPLSAVYNESSGLSWFGILADDVVPETPDWDRILIETAGHDGLAYGDDGINGETHATHFVLGCDLVKDIGFVALPGLNRIFIDTVWNDIARARGVMRYRPDVKLTHMHFSNGLAAFDRTYAKPGKSFDRDIYQQWKDTQ